MNAIKKPFVYLNSSLQTLLKLLIIPKMMQKFFCNIIRWQGNHFNLIWAF